MSNVGITSCEDLLRSSFKYLNDKLPFTYSEAYLELLQQFILKLFNKDRLYFCLTQTETREIVSCTPESKIIFISHPLLEMYLNFPIMLKQSFSKKVKCFNFNSVFDMDYNDNPDRLKKNYQEQLVMEPPIYESLEELTSPSTNFYQSRMQSKYSQAKAPILRDRDMVRLILITRVMLVALHFYRHFKTHSYREFEHTDGDDFFLPRRNEFIRKLTYSEMTVKCYDDEDDRRPRKKLKGSRNDIDSDNSDATNATTTSDSDDDHSSRAAAQKRRKRTL